MRFEQLNCLQEIARTGSITSAAKNLFISQQAVSNSIKQLEEELGVQLMVRSATGISLTAEGKDAVNFAQQMLKDRENFKKKMKYRQEHQSALELLDINICSTSSVVNTVLPKVLAELDILIPKVTMHVSLGNNAEDVLQGLVNDDFQIGLVTLNEHRLHDLSQTYDLEYDVLCRDEVVGVLSHRVSNVEKKAIETNDFDSDLISLYGLEPLEEYMEGISRYISVSNDINFHKNVVTELDAIVLLSGLAAKKFFHSSKYLILPLKDIDVPLVHAAVYHRTIGQEYWDVVQLIRKVMIQS